MVIIIWFMMVIALFDPKRIGMISRNRIAMIQGISRDSVMPEAGAETCARS